MQQVLDLFLHLDHHVADIIQQYGTWVYLIIFVIIFCETGLVFTPFLPGDSLLFVLGTFSATGALELKWVLLILFSAAIIGDNTNYWIGRLLAPKIFKKKHIRFLNQKHLARTQLFYEKYGVSTIIIARFMPIIRTFAPFLAGVGSMRYLRFFLFDVFGGLLWVGVVTLGGYFFGNIPTVRKHFSLVVLAIIIISLIPAVVEYLRHRKDADSVSI